MRLFKLPFSWQVTLAFSLASLIFPSAIRGQEWKSSQWLSLMNAAQEKAELGKTGDAIALYRQAEELLARRPEDLPSSPWGLLSADATGWQAKTYNDYAVELLRSRDASKAVQLLASLDVDHLPGLSAATRSRYQYNYGRALESAGNSNAANAYLASLRWDTSFEAAAEALMRLARASEPAVCVETAASLSDLLIEGGSLALAERALLQSLEVPEWSAFGDASARLLESLVRLWTAMRSEIVDFQQAWGLLLNGLMVEDTSPELRRRLREIFAAFLLPLSIEFDANQAQQLFPAWSNSPSDAVIFSQLLTRIGDAYLRANEPQQALQRYALAWSMNHENAEPALYIANILMWFPQEVDSSDELLDDFVEELFGGGREPNFPDDLPNTLRLYSVLGEIFAKKESWGSPSEPKSAIFQWEQAVGVQKRLDDEHMLAQAVPVLHQNLADAYMQTGETSLAKRYYLRAAEGYQVLDRTESADAMSDRAESIDTMPHGTNDTHYRSEASGLFESGIGKSEERSFATVREALIEFQQQTSGVSYQWGSCTSTRMDVSCFIQRLFATQFGYFLPRTTLAQASSIANVRVTSIRRPSHLTDQNLCIGDLIYTYSGRSWHQGPRQVAVYAGNDQVLHCSPANSGVGASQLAWVRLHNLYAVFRPIGCESAPLRSPPFAENATETAAAIRAVIDRLFATWETQDLEQFRSCWSPIAVQWDLERERDLNQIIEERQKIFRTLVAAREDHRYEEIIAWTEYAFVEVVYSLDMEFSRHTYNQQDVSASFRLRRDEDTWRIISRESIW